MINSAYQMIILGAGLTAAVILSIGAAGIAMTIQERSQRAHRGGAAFALGAVGVFIAIVAVSLAVNSGPQDAQDLCPTGTFNQFPQGPGVCVILDDDDDW